MVPGAKVALGPRVLAVKPGIDRPGAATPPGIDRPGAANPGTPKVPWGAYREGAPVPVP
tara:strand:- start:1452 stop:1628 length:177 start_codon:yes stop_codon:yes gene_type:complete